MHATHFQQYAHGPNLPRNLFDVNVRNAAKYVVESRRNALSARSWESRWNREWNAVEYRDAKRQLAFLNKQL